MCVLVVILKELASLYSFLYAYCHSCDILYAPVTTITFLYTFCHNCNIYVHHVSQFWHFCTHVQWYNTVWYWCAKMSHNMTLMFNNIILCDMYDNITVHLETLENRLRHSIDFQCLNTCHKRSNDHTPLSPTLGYSTYARFGTPEQAHSVLHPLTNINTRNNIK